MGKRKHYCVWGGDGAGIYRRSDDRQVMSEWTLRRQYGIYTSDIATWSDKAIDRLVADYVAKGD